VWKLIEVIVVWFSALINTHVSKILCMCLGTLYTQSASKVNYFNVEMIAALTRKDTQSSSVIDYPCVLFFDEVIASNMDALDPNCKGTHVHVHLLLCV